MEAGALQESTRSLFLVLLRCLRASLTVDPQDHSIVEEMGEGRSGILRIIWEESEVGKGATPRAKLAGVWREKWNAWARTRGASSSTQRKSPGPSPAEGGENQSTGTQLHHPETCLTRSHPQSHDPTGNENKNDSP